MATTPRPITSLTDAITAIEQPTQDALLAAQLRRQQMEAEYQAQLLAMQQAQAAAAQPAAPTQAPATAQPTVPTQPGPWDQVAQSQFAREFLPTRKIDVGGFAALPFEEREKLANEYIDSRAKAEKMTPEQRKQLETVRDKVVYADNGGKAPSIAGRIGGDVVDSLWSGLRGFGTGAAAAGLSSVGAEDAANAVRRFQKEGQAEDVKDFNASTKDVLRRQAFRKEQRGDAERTVGEALSDFGGDLLRAPGATIGGLVGGTLPSLAVAAATRGRSLGVQGLGLGGLGAAGGLNVNEAVFQEGLDAGLTPEQARERANRAGAVAAQVGAGTVEAVGGRLGIEGLLARGAGRGVRQTGAALAAEGAEGAAANAAGQVSSNVAFDRDLVFGVPASAAEGAAQEIVGGAAVRPFVGLLNREQGAAIAPPALPTRPGPLDGAPAAPAAPDLTNLTDLTQRGFNPQVVMDEWVDTSAMGEPTRARAAEAVEAAIRQAGGAGVTREDLQAAGVPVQPAPTPVAQEQQPASLGRVYAPSTRDVRVTAPAPLESAELAELRTLEKNTKSRTATAEEASRISELQQRQVLAGSALVDADDTTTYELPDGTVYTGKLRVTNEAPKAGAKPEPRIFIEPTDGSAAVRVMPEALGIDSKQKGWATRLTSAIAAAQQNYETQATAQVMAQAEQAQARAQAQAAAGSAASAALGPDATPQERALAAFSGLIGPAPSLNRPDPALLRRDDTGVPDVMVAPATLDLLATPQYADTVVESLTRTASTPQKRAMATFLLDKLKRTQIINGVDIPVRVVPNLTYTDPKTGQVSRASGLYSRNNGQPEILLDQESGQTEEVIGHEVGHAVTLAYMEVPMESLTPTQQAARVDIESIYQRVLEQPWASMFEIPNVGEFITEAWNNPRMQKAMKDTPYTGKLTVWGKFKESLRQLLGINKLQMPDNQFEALLVASDALTRNAMRDATLGGDAPAINRKVLDSTEKRVSSYKGFTLTLEGGPDGPTVRATDKDGAVIADLYTYVDGENLLVSLVNVGAGYRGQGIARAMYSALADTGSDVARSANQLPDGADMWDAFERSGFATDGVIVGRVRGDIPARQRRAPPEDATPQDVTPQKQVRQIQEIIYDEAETEQEQASKNRDDFMEAGLDNERGLLRGSAYLADTPNDIWVGRWFNEDGSKVEQIIRGQGNMRDWLESFGKVENGKVVARSTVTRTAKDSGYENTYDGVMDRLSALTPGARQWYDRALAIGMSPNAAYTAVMGARDMRRFIASRSSALSAFGPAVVEGFNRRRAQARAEIASGGYDYASLRDLTETVYAGIDAVAAQGIPVDLVKEYVNAQSAVQNNAMKLAKLPTDMAGRPRLDKGDFVKFSYYQDASGNAHMTNAPGRTLVDGVSAPQKFIEAFNQQYPDVRAQLKAVLDGVRETNKYVLDQQLAMGVIGQEDYSKLAAQDLYLPNQQVGKTKRPSGYISRALGRTTKAESPTDQWQGVLASRLEAAYYKGAIMALARHLQANPNAAIATINSSDIKPVEHPDVDEDGKVVNPSRRIAADWTGENSITGWLGARQVKITFNDPVVAKALKPGAGLLTNWPTINAAVNIARMATTMMVATPAFWLKSATWDLLGPAFFTQGSFNTDGRELTAAESLRLTAGTYKRVIPALAGSVKQSFGEAMAGGMSPRTADPLRTLYNARGGGVNLSAVHTSSDALLQSQGALSGLRGQGKRAFHTFTASGHVMSDAIRFAAFRAFLEQANGGKFKSDAELRTFVESNPAVLDNAILGSKRVLGNYEDVGQQMLLRSVVPFFNAAAVGMTQQIPKIYGTSQGRGAMAALAGLAYLAALAATEDEEDKDTDGFGKHLRRASSWESLHIGDAVIPVPHEMRMAIWAGNYMAAMSSNKRQDMDKVTSMFVKTAYQTLIPLPGVASTVEGRSFATDFGPIGTLALLAGANDPWGKARVNREWTENAENRAQGLYNFPNNADTSWAVAISKGIYDSIGYNIAPTTVDMLLQLPAGGYYSGLKEVFDKAEAEGKTAGQAFEDWLIKAYEPSKDDPYASLTRWQNELKSVASSDNLLQRQDYDATAKQVKQLTKGITTTMEAQADARRAGDANLWSQYERERRAKQAGADAVRNQYYERTGNANRNLLQ